MVILYRCDRCGAESKDYDDFFCATAPATSIDAYTKLGDMPEETFDLCKSCATALVMFMLRESAAATNLSESLDHPSPPLPDEEPRVVDDDIPF